MGFFRNMRNAMIRFMYGRNGMDQLNRALFWVYLAVCVIRAVSINPGPTTRVTIWDVLLWVLAAVILFRTFSKNLYKRRAENQKWINWWWKVKNRSAGAKARHADKEHKYFTCKACKTICRVPVGKGKIVITCPKCGGQIQARS